MQSNTNNPPTSRTAWPTAFTYSSGSNIPEDVSTCGANTKSGFSFRMTATNSSIGTGINGAVFSFPVWRARHTISIEGMLPISKIWVQR